MKQEIKKIGGNLLPTKPDSRDFKLGQIVILPDLSELPDEFMFEGLSIDNQHQSDFCTAAATTKMKQLQEDEEFEMSWHFAVSKKISGNPEGYGQNMRTAFKVLVKYGAVRKQDSPYNLDNKSPQFLRYIDNWPDLFPKAKPYKAESFFQIDGPYDAFDNIKAAIWLFRKQKRAAGVGVRWGWSFNDIIIDTIPERGGGHMMFVKGFNKHYLIVQNSYGEKCGDNGVHYFSREVINEMVRIYKGPFMTVDMPPEEAKKKCWSWWRKIIEAVKNYIKNLFQ